MSHRLSAPSGIVATISGHALPLRSHPEAETLASRSWDIGDNTESIRSPKPKVKARRKADIPRPDLRHPILELPPRVEPIGREGEHGKIIGVRVFAEVEPTPH
jgi:hypothetical protein